jgi:hypothetical protein
MKTDFDKLLLQVRGGKFSVDEVKAFHRKLLADGDAYYQKIAFGGTSDPTKGTPYEFRLTPAEKLAVKKVLAAIDNRFVQRALEESSLEAQSGLDKIKAVLYEK